MSDLSLFICIFLALSPWPLLFPVIRGALEASFKKTAITLGLLWAGWVGLAVLLGLFSPGLSYALSVLVVVTAAILWWRGRETYGQIRGLPKGSLALSESVLAILDREYYLKAASRYGAIFKISQFHQPTICIVGLDLGHRLFREHKGSIGPCPQQFNREVTGGFLRYMDEVTHADYSRLFRRALSSDVMDDAQTDVQVACKAAMDTLAETCSSGALTGVSPRALCEQISFDAFVRVLFGITPSSGTYAEFKKAYAGLERYNIGSRADAATRKSQALVRQILQDHAEFLAAGGPVSDSTSALLELNRQDADLPDHVCLDNLIYICKISTANVASLLLWLFKMLGDNPAWMKQISEKQGTDEQSAVINRVMKETLRLSQSEYLYRQLLQDVHFEGMTLPKDWLVRLCVWESHRSEALFEHPAEFDPDRFLRKNFSRSEYAPFGYGAHSCNGIEMTEMICAAWLKELAAGFDWSITNDGPLQRSLRHWSHWQPSAEMRVHLSAR